jgi:hypothetical protein
MMGWGGQLLLLLWLARAVGTVWQWYIPSVVVMGQGLLLPLLLSPLPSLPCPSLPSSLPCLTIVVVGCYGGGVAAAGGGGVG